MDSTTIFTFCWWSEYKGKAGKEKGKKLNQKQTQDRHLPLLLSCRCGEDDYRDNRHKILTIFPKRFLFMLEDNKNGNAYCKIFTNVLGCLVFPLKNGYGAQPKILKEEN